MLLSPARAVGKIEGKENKEVRFMTAVHYILKELWYKYYSGGWCTWPTPLKYAESKFKYTEA